MNDIILVQSKYSKHDKEWQDLKNPKFTLIGDYVSFMICGLDLVEYDFRVLATRKDECEEEEKYLLFELFCEEILSKYNAIF